MDPQLKLQELLDSVVTDIADRERIVKAIGETTSATVSMEQTSQIAGAEVDLGRAVRCGFPEVVYAEGKPAQLVVDVFRSQQAVGQSSLATRVSSEQAAAIQQAFPDAIYHPAARTVRRSVSEQSNEANLEPAVAVVTAGSCDLPVAAEAMETLAWMGVAARLIEDVGVAGPQRLLSHVPMLQKMKCIVCVAGMEAALPSVLGGHVNCPVIGVPTSVGYGASFMGLAALLSMLNCCASNVVTVNIDGGFRGGYVAGMIASGQNALA
ncbi:MAG: nickel pincer cofactor biosynthesis protein LarB [Fuerstiella sp.]